MINYLISILVSLGFWGKATQETEEKTEKSSWLRTGIYFVLSIFVGVLFYKTYQIQQSSWFLASMQAKGAYNQKGGSLDSLSIIVRKFATAHDSIWLKSHNEKYLSSGIEFNYICANDSNAIYKLNRKSGEFFPLDVIGTSTNKPLPNISKPGYKSINKVRYDYRTPGQMQYMLQDYFNNRHVEPHNKYILHNYEESLYSDLAAAYKTFFLISKPASLNPFATKFSEEEYAIKDLPFIESIKNIDVESIKESGLSLSYLNGDSMDDKQRSEFLKEANYLNGDMYDITALVPTEITNQMPDGMRFISSYFFNSEEYSTDFFSAFDLSQSTQQIQIKSEVPISVLQIKFDIPFELIGCDPQPDLLSTCDIGYNDPEKTKQIQEKGVNFHVKFPTMENKQLIRSLVLTTILTAICSLFLSNLYFCIRKSILSWKDKLKIMISKKFQYLINTLIVLMLGCLSYFSYLLVFNEKIIVEAENIWLYITVCILGVIVLSALVILACKKLK